MIKRFLIFMLAIFSFFSFTSCNKMGAYIDKMFDSNKSPMQTNTQIIENNVSIEANEIKPIPFDMDDFYTYTKDPNWYDNGIFSTYMKREYPNDAWSYMGSFYCDMEVNPCGYLGFEVFTHLCESDKRIYTYLVPITPASAPVVYLLNEKNETMQLVFKGVQ